jgi:hypothetical protein
MTDNYTDDAFDSDDEAGQDPNDIKSLRKAANSKKQIEQENHTLKRELAFLKAGINTDDPKMRYFVKGYEGDLTPDAVRQAALEAGFLASQQQGNDPELQQAAAAQQRVMQASAGAGYEDVSEEAALARLEAAMEEGGVDAMLEVARQYGIPTNIEQ